MISPFLFGSAAASELFRSIPIIQTHSGYKVWQPIKYGSHPGHDGRSWAFALKRQDSGILGVRGSGLR